MRFHLQILQRQDGLECWLMHSAGTDREGVSRGKGRSCGTSAEWRLHAPCRGRNIEAIQSPGGAGSGVGWQDAVGHGGDEAEILMPHAATLEVYAAGDADGGGVDV